MLYTLLQKHIKKIISLRYKYNQLLSDCITRAFIFMQQKYFQFGEKPHKLFARQLRKMESDCTISRVKSEDGDILTSQKAINHRFKQFYESLYSSRAMKDDSIVQKFLDSCNLPTLTQEDKNFLNADFSILDIQDAIKSLKKMGKQLALTAILGNFIKSLVISCHPIC